MTTIRASLTAVQCAAADRLMAQSLESEHYSKAIAAFRAGADPTILASNGHSALTLAARANDVEAAEQLLRAGAHHSRPPEAGNDARFIFPDKFIDSQPEHRDMLTLLSAWRASAALGYEPNTPAFDRSLQSLRQPGSVLETFFKTVNVGGYKNSGHNAILSFSSMPAAAVGDDKVAALGFSAFEGNLHYQLPRQQILESHEMRDPENYVVANRIRPAPSTYVESATVTYHDDEQNHNYVRGTLFFSKDGSNLDAFVNDRPRLVVTSVLDDAIAEGRHDAIRVSIRAGADLYRCFDGGRFTALSAAVEANDPVAVDIVAKEGLPVNAEDFHKRTALHNAARGKTTYDVPDNADVMAQRTQAVVLALLTHGADVNAADADKRTPLHMAVLHDQPPAVAMLLQAGADTSLRDRNGKTAEDSLRPGRDDEMVQVFSSWRAQKLLAAGRAPAAPAP